MLQIYWFSSIECACRYVHSTQLKFLTEFIYELCQSIALSAFNMPNLVSWFVSKLSKDLMPHLACDFPNRKHNHLMSPLPLYVALTALTQAHDLNLVYLYAHFFVSCVGHSDYHRYFYRHTASGASQWDYPEPGKMAQYPRQTDPADKVTECPSESKQSAENSQVQYLQNYRVFYAFVPSYACLNSNDFCTFCSCQNCMVVLLVSRMLSVTGLCWVEVSGLSSSLWLQNFWNWWFWTSVYYQPKELTP